MRGQPRRQELFGFIVTFLQCSSLRKTSDPEQRRFHWIVRFEYTLRHYVHSQRLFESAPAIPNHGLYEIDNRLLRGIQPESVLILGF